MIIHDIQAMRMGLINAGYRPIRNIDRQNTKPFNRQEFLEHARQVVSEYRKHHSSGLSHRLEEDNARSNS
jgi:hypothetical protein